MWRASLASFTQLLLCLASQAISTLTAEVNAELLVAAREIAEQQGEQGPLRVHHVHEAYQQLDREGRIPHRTPQQQLLLR